MPVSRRAVLESLAAASDHEDAETTTVSALATTLGTDQQVVDAHIDGLVACEFAVRMSGERVRVTTTGAEFLALDVSGPIVVAASAGVTE